MPTTRRFVPIVPIALVALLLTLATAAPALTMRLGADHPSGPVDTTGWPEEFGPLVNGPDRVHGFWVNWSDTFFLKGNAAKLNGFLATCAAIDGATIEFTIHPGDLAVCSPWEGETPPNNDRQGDWRVIALRHNDWKPGDAFPIWIDLWLGGDVELNRLDVPKSVVVKSGGEIEAFVAKHHEKQATH